MIAHTILKEFWGHDQFRPLQSEIIQTALDNKDCLALLPTGGGKSLCFQIPALLKEGICIVVSPLIALMKDQVENLKAKGISAVAIYAGMGKREIDILLDNCIYGNIKFLYLSPERLLSRIVRERIAYMKVNLIAIDEAHCISQWGYDFRPAYLQISHLRQLHPLAPILALTATATPRVKTDIIEKLSLNDPQVFSKSFERLNLSYVVYSVDDKYKRLISVLKNVKGSGIIYVRNRRACSEVAQFLTQQGIPADFYHAGLTKEERTARQDAWKMGSKPIIVATNAFGMGIDKPNVRTVIHLDLPDSLEAYYQEAGRAGRDGQRAYAVLLANDHDKDLLTSRLSATLLEISEVKKIYHHLGSYFQLAYGAGEGMSFPFDMVEFSKRYELSPLKVYHALKYLEKDNLITLTDAIFEPSKINFLTSHEDLYRFQIENKAYDQIIKTILRSYGGAFEHFVKISESEIAQRCGFSTLEVKGLLKKFHEMEILNYQEQSDQAQLVFNRARLDTLHLDVDVKFIQERQDIYKQQIEAVIQYADRWVCRSLQIRSYFGEVNPNVCGVCDVCLAEKKKEPVNLRKDKLRFELIQSLQLLKLDLEEIMDKFSSEQQEELITLLREMLDAGKIKSDGKKFYL